ncbi:uncharacterized protein PHACADRAFT_143280 [Phanerochaete carnosa HHB-10118-sp]|uniref:Major facilitator superfamily (MFS) profile domain-containing protein n=1 Tax=Phanerochaete carnosa (strain HHB-10118-sp) TaxID=650164 RepID=K5W7R9_PHACS|nr:uncharacterized protein PHACADRAFT_143280 [Phanerochaete carnosa HHB-10118-sp]EKM55220.1 hypothetical protein PHACADRAFT_143280 [Phanerochaete carnosa HHB-10118-sp]
MHPPSMSLSRNLSPRGPAISTRASGHGSWAPSLPRRSRASPKALLAYLSGRGESSSLPDDPIGEEAVELSYEFVHPRHQDPADIPADAGEREADDSDTASLEEMKGLPWYKRPNPWWLLALVPFAAVARGAEMAPRIGIYTQLACAAYKPELSSDNGTLPATYTYAPGYDPRLCAKDPVVQEAVAQMNMAVSVTTGVLTCLTAAWWGSLSDRFGRIRTLSFAVFGLLMTDVNFLVVTRWHTVLPGGYWFLLVGPFLDGLLGGMPALMAAIHAYVADCTEPGERTHAFSRFLGLLFIGVGAGPSFGSLLIRLSGSVLSVFYFAMAIHLVCAMFFVFVIPESLSIRRMFKARRIKREQLEKERYTPKARGLNAWPRSLFGFLHPLAIFYPTRMRDSANPLKRGKRDWNLFFIVLAYGFTISVTGAYPYKFQYTSATFGWGSEQNGYWLSIIGATRAAYLTIILPLAIKLVKSRRRSAVQLPVDQDEPLRPISEPPATPPRTEPPPKRPTPTNDASRSTAFDVGLARVSLAIDVVSYALVPLASTGPQYTAATALGAFGAGFGPALQSVALGLYTRRNGGSGAGAESGRLFGALSVVQSLCSDVLGPALHGFTFVHTVRTFPTAIFCVASACTLAASVFLALVRLPREGLASGGEEGPAPRAAGGDGEEAERAPEIDAAVPQVAIEEDAGGKAGSPPSLFAL